MTFIREEEKLARDVYVVLSEQWKEPVFSNIAVSEQRHMDGVLGLLTAYDVPDPAAGNPVGIFTDPAIRDLYLSLVGRGRESLAAAYQVGVDIETMDIQDLTEAITITNSAGLAEAHDDVLAVYAHLRSASRRHLDAFSSHLK